MNRHNRRDFLKLSAMAAAVTAAPGAVNAFDSESPRGQVAVWSTFGDQRCAKQAPIAWSAKPATTNVIAIDPDQRYQSLLGFGAAFTDAACFTLNRLRSSERADLFRELFSADEMNLSVSRICIGSSDYSSTDYSYSPGTEPDPELKKFSIAHDREYILPILREVRSVNPEMWLLASPWSPPAWMKFNKSMLGGSMRRKWLNAYANYFDRFLAAYVDAGVKVNAITPQNEVDTDQDGKMPACIWPQEYEIEFVRDHLGPLMSKSPNPAEIWILDHNYNLWGRAMCELEDERLRKFTKGVAWHGYAGTPDAMSRVQKAYPSIDQFWTEGGPDFDTPGYETEWCKWARQFTDILRNRARCIIAWNYALDEKGKPNIGPFNCAGMVTVDSSSLKITRSGQYWALRHFSRHFHRGATIVASRSEIAGVSHVVARNPQGSYTGVLTNEKTTATAVSLVMGRSSTNVTLEGNSVMTLEWN